MNTKLIFTILSIFLFTNILLAQDKEAENLLKELSEKTNAFDNIKVSFAYKMLNEEAGIDETTNGTLLVSGNKYHLNIAGQEVISDGATLWTYLVDSEEVQVNEVIEDEGFSPNKLLSSYNEEYTSKKEDDIIKDGKKFYQLKLKPIDKESSFDFVRLIIDAEKMQLESFIMYDFESNIFSYNIKQFVSNTDISNSEFTFDNAKYPDVEVIDMR